MPGTLERSEVVEKATRLVNRGDLDGAVRIYARLFEEDSRDWSIGNTLGDLYVRLGRADDAISHFTVLAEQLAADGFAAKARALYRKILRIRPNNGLARQRVDELEKQQAGQTSPFLKRVLETARTLRETEAAAASPNPATPEAPPPAEIRAREEPATPAVLPPAPAIPVQPESAPMPIVKAETEEVEVPLSFSAPPSVQAGPVRMPQTASEWADEWAAVISTPAPTPAPAPAPPPPPSLAAPPPAPPIEGAGEFEMMEAEADAAVAQRDYRAAAAVVEDFLVARPDHVGALEKLIELGVDGGLGSQLILAQVRLVDACLRAERYAQAYQIVLDLIARHPESSSHPTLLERVKRVAREHGVTFPALPEFDEPTAQRDGSAPISAAQPDVPTQPATVQPPVRILRPDFTEVSRRPRTDKPAAEKISTPGGALAELLQEWGDPELAFEDVRSALLDEAAAAAEERFAEGTRFVDARQFDAAMRAFEEAMCAPHLRASAGSRLARIYREQGAAMEALTCLEWVAEMPPSNEESGHELAYELALTLETLGQHAQALGLYRELLAEVGPAYRDVQARAQRLSAA